MLSQITITHGTAVPAAALAAQSLLDSVHATLKAEATKVCAALSTMNFSMFAVDGPMLSGGWEEGME